MVTDRLVVHCDEDALDVYHQELIEDWCHNAIRIQELATSGMHRAQWEALNERQQCIQREAGLS